MYACPHCNKPGISLLSRATLGPALPAKCAACGAKVGVPWGSSFLALLPLMTGLLVSAFLTDRTLGAIALAVGACVTVLLSHKFVPLIRK